jgi:hypothetical protein
MLPDMPAYLERRRKFLANRGVFPAEELARYAGLWVAWSPDGTRVAASAEALETLEGLLRKAGEDPAECVFEGIPDGQARRSRTTSPWTSVRRKSRPA